MPDKSPSPRASFSKLNPSLQLAVDSTSLSAFKKCPQYYKLSILDSYTPFGDGSPHLIFGTLFHKGTEIYDHLRAEGTDHETSILSVLEEILLLAWNAETQSFWSSDIPEKTLKTLLRTLVWYFDHFKTDHLKTLLLENGRPAVELSFTINLNDLSPDGSFVASTGEDFILCGHIDKAVEFMDSIALTDKKTTKTALSESWFQNFNPDNQVSCYSVAGRVILHRDISGLIIDGVQVQALGNRFMRRFIPRTPGQLEEWLEDLKLTLRLMDSYAVLNYWPRNDTACSMYGGCSFRSICGSDPSVRDQLLEAFFVKRDVPWDPIRPR